MNDMLSLVEPLIPMLRRYARSLLKNQAAADDLVQDCLEKTITGWHQRRPDGDTRTWVFTILHNLAINRVRQSARRGHHMPIDDMDETMAFERPTQELGLMHADVLTALDRLHDDQRSVLLLISVEDLSYADAAKVLDIPIGTVMSRLSRARERMRRLLDDEVEHASGAPILRRVK